MSKTDDSAASLSEKDAQFYEVCLEAAKKPTPIKLRNRNVASRATMTVTDINEKLAQAEERRKTLEAAKKRSSSIKEYNNIMGTQRP